MSTNTIDKPKSDFAEKMRLAREAKQAAKAAGDPAPAPPTEKVQDADTFNPVTTPPGCQTDPVEAPPAASAEGDLPELVEVQKGLRWVASKPFYHREVMSCGEDSGWDNNMYLRAIGAVERAFSPLFTTGTNKKPDVASHKLDPTKMPPFSQDVCVEVTVRIIPSGGS